MNSEIYWQAVKNNDRRFDGAFYTGVLTTGIFCKPSCSARLPKRKNVVFFDSCEKAEADGFRACLRCKPKAEFAIDAQVGTVIRACKMLELGENTSLKQLSSALSVSSYHLQRTFKKIVGVTPKKYSEALRLERFKGELRDGKEVVDAMYEAGYGSSSRLYENVSGRLGMTPGRYKKGGEGMNIDYAITDCDLGRLLVARTKQGICSVKFGDNDNELSHDLLKEYPKAAVERNHKNLKQFVDEILAFLEGREKTLDLPIDVQATAFQMKVWEALRKIPYGKTITYKQLAERLGNPKAVRAVASACAKNQVALVIPCHRVVGSDGKMTGYRWGVERKKKLLKHEKRI